MGRVGQKCAADAHDAGWYGVFGKKAGQLMLMMLAAWGVLSKKAGQLLFMMLAGAGC